MAANRVWNLRLNLDAFNAAWLTLDTTEDRSAFLLGLCKGMNGGKLPTDPPQPLVDGFGMGSTMRKEAEGYRESRRVIGLLGGNPKLKRNHKVNHKVKVGLTLPLPQANHMDNAIPNPLTFNQNPESTNEERVCSEPSAQSPTSGHLIYEIPCVGTGSKTWPLTEEKMAEWVEAYPGMDVKAELRKAVQWLKDNPTKGKTSRGMPAFLGRWLSNAQDKPSKTGAFNGTSKSPAHRAGVDEAYKQQLREREANRLQPKPEPTPEDEAAIEELFRMR